MKSEILQLLRKNNSFLSGQEISSKLSVSRTAVWKSIHQLQELGYDIEAVRNKGYRLRHSPDILNEDELFSILKTKMLGSKIFYYEELDSTNNEAKRLAENGIPHGSIVIAEIQNAGKGRRGRNWNSPSKEGIWFSLLLRPDILPDKASMLTLVMAMAVTKGIERVTKLKPQIKWPNDIILNRKKVCGILTEMSVSMDEIDYIVVGAGINVHNQYFSEELADKATSIDLELVKNVGEETSVLSRSVLLERILIEFENYYDKYMINCDLTYIYEEYNQYLINAGNQVKIIGPQNSYEAISSGIDRDGALLVEKDGKIERISSGEVSVRGIYGYV